MTSWLIVLGLIAAGAIIGGWLARRMPLDSTRIFAAIATIVAASLIIATRPTSLHARWVSLPLVVIVGSYVGIALTRRWRGLAK